MSESERGQSKEISQTLNVGVVDFVQSSLRRVVVGLSALESVHVAQAGTHAGRLCQAAAAQRRAQRYIEQWWSCWPVAAVAGSPTCQVGWQHGGHCAAGGALGPAAGAAVPSVRGDCRLVLLVVLLDHHHHHSSCTAVCVCVCGVGACGLCAVGCACDGSAGVVGLEEPAHGGQLAVDSGVDRHAH